MHGVLLIGPNQSTTASTTTKGRLFGGAMTVIDDELTGSAEIGPGTVVGKARGFCVGSAEEGTSKTVAFTAMFEEGGHYKDSLSFFGVQRIVGAEESRVAVMGGTGKYVGAKGYATVQAVVTGGGEHVTDGVGTLLQFFVYLA
ncbi:hypothetical protein QJS10_CPA03g01455 [Acorus calamus]|uniref:Dirigent protein n=1 Tax=Acorus calamus TaxID=4465 RepID=A0AAV9F9W6_ACOCL|nr:hypothetical protein QJS10_CPA03g01455 [Acorus calamus]